MTECAGGFISEPSRQIDFKLTGARFAKEQPIHWFAAQQRFQFAIETEPTASGEIQIAIAGLPAGTYRVVSGQQKTEFPPDATTPLRLRIPAGTAKATVEILRS